MLKAKIATFLLLAYFIFSGFDLIIQMRLFRCARGAYKSIAVRMWRFLLEAVSIKMRNLIKEVTRSRTSNLTHLHKKQPRPYPDYKTKLFIGPKITLKSNVKFL